jgi:dipeptidyl aminopeptidase/acylaminoacyl peptidase
VSVHGGPNWHHTDGYEPTVQSYVDHGYAVLLVNYRGSTGFGRAFRDAIRGHLGTLESEDVNAALDHAVAAGWVDPQRVALEGWSWGGYLATLNAGLRPDRWRAVCAGIPVGDYVASHYESAPELRAWDVAMFGDPVEEAERYRAGNPITYVQDVRAPVLLIAGEQDSRCPLGQVMTYAVALKALGRPVDVHLYRGGHHANATEEQVLHVELVTGFIERWLAVNPPTPT